MTTDANEAMRSAWSMILANDAWWALLKRSWDPALRDDERRGLLIAINIVERCIAQMERPPEARQQTGPMGHLGGTEQRQESAAERISRLDEDRWDLIREGKW